MLDNSIHLVGNLTEDPTHYAAAGASSRSNFRIAANERRFDRQTGSYVDGTTLYLDVVAWRNLADHVYATLRKGDRVVIVGRLRRREFVNAQQEQRSRMEVEADAVGPDLRNVAATVHRAPKRTLDPPPVEESPLPPEPGIDPDLDPGIDEVRPEMEVAAPAA